MTVSKKESTTSKLKDWYAIEIGYLENIITKEIFLLRRCQGREELSRVGGWTILQPEQFVFFTLGFPYTEKENFVKNLAQNKKAVYRLVSNKDTLGLPKFETFVRIRKVNLSKSRYDVRHGLQRVTSMVVQKINQFEVFKYADKYNKKYGTQISINTENTIA